MCHNSAFESEQIDKCIENGMPYKIVKTIKYTMRKRAAVASTIVGDERRQFVSDSEYSEDDNGSRNELKIFKENKSNKIFQMKCPFAHGLISPPRTFESPLGELSDGSELEVLNMYGRLPTSHTDEFSNTNNTSGAANIANLSGHIEKTPAKSTVYSDDILAKSTQFTRRLTFHMQQALRHLQSSKTYTLLTKTAQPVHVVAICILLFVLLTVWPELIDGTSAKQKYILEKKHDHDPSANRKYMLALIAYLGAFSTHFGSQIWMTFVSGLSLYFSLPRHMFGQCQQILFPKYFAMNGVLSITMLILYVKFFLNSWTLPQCIQLGALSVTGAIEVIVRLYLAPPLLRLMLEKYKIEGTIGSGKEVGSLVQGDLIQCPHYQRIHKAFRRTHMTVAIGNLITMIASCLHLYYIAGQIQISL